MLLDSQEHSIVSPKIKASPEMVRETLGMLEMDFSDFDKYKSHRNIKDRSRIATTSV